MTIKEEIEDLKEELKRLETTRKKIVDSINKDVYRVDSFFHDNEIAENDKAMAAFLYVKKLKYDYSYSKVRKSHNNGNYYMINYELDNFGNGTPTTFICRTKELSKLPIFNKNLWRNLVTNYVTELGFADWSYKLERGKFTLNEVLEFLDHVESYTHEIVNEPKIKLKDWIVIIPN